MIRVCSSIVGSNLSRWHNSGTLNLVKSAPVIRTNIVADHSRPFQTSTLQLISWILLILSFVLIGITCHKTSKLIILLIRPIASAITGRLFRWWWQNMDQAQRLKYLNWFARNRVRILSSIGLYFGSLVVYYQCNIEETPITKRRRFMAFNNDQQELVNKQASATMTEGYHAMDPTHPYVKRVVDTGKRIVRANKDIEQFQGIEWRVSVVDAPGKLNSMVTADGHIIVFKDTIELCATDDELAFILSHEMSHAMLNHVAEKLSKVWLVGSFTAPLLFLIWVVCSDDVFAAIFSCLQIIAMHVTLSLPNYREIETEADAVGLRLAAKACLDVRQAVSFFKRMEMLKKKGLPTGNDEKPSLGEYMSTHPTHEHRWKFMEKQLESAMLLRDECKCEPLGPLPEEVARHMLLEKELDRTTHNRII